MLFSKSKTFLACCLSFAFGVAIASFLPEKISDYNFYFFIFIIVFLVSAFYLWPQAKIRFASLIGAFLFFGVWRFFINLPAAGPDKIWHYNNQEISFAGIITAFPEARQASQKLTIKALSFFDGKRETPVSGKVLVTANLYPEYDYGDKLIVNCRLTAPAEFNGFAYDKYLARYDIYSLCAWPEIRKIGSGQGSLARVWLFKIKKKAVGAINQGLDEPAAGLAKAIVFGDRRGLSEDLAKAFSQTGTAHITAVSGLHVTIVTALVMQFLLAVGLSRKYAFFAAVFFLAAFVSLVGAPASALRAGLMGFLALLALRLGRLNKITNAIALAAAVMLVFNPKLLRYDIGFQLSFLAVLGLVYFSPLLSAGWEKFKLPDWQGVRQILSMTLAAQIFTLPITAINFGLVSLSAVFANLLIIWTLPILLTAVLAGAFFSWLFPLGALYFFTPSWLVLQYVAAVVSFISKLPLAFFAVTDLNPIWAALYYLAIFIILFYARKKKRGPLSVADTRPITVIGRQF